MNVASSSPTAQWVLKRPRSSEAKELASKLFISPIVAQVLLNRELGDSEAMARFLKPQTSDMASPLILRDMQRAVTRIIEARDKGQRILIHGDYDVDGITSSSMLYLLLNKMGVTVEAYLPDRFKDGYGLNTATLESLTITNYDLIITADCGVTAHAQADWIKEQGVDLIIVDHHEFDDQLPAAVAVVHPRITTAESFGDLCAAATMLKLILALVESDAQARFIANKIMPDLLMLAAIGTVCDVMPLLGENRIIVDTGFRVASGLSQPGLARIVKIITDSNELTAGRVGFQIGPRINAGGRMGKTRLGFELFTTDDDARAQEILAQLEKENSRRQETEKLVTAAAYEQAQGYTGESARCSLVVAGDQWHEGVIGIVASRLIDAHYLPSVVIAFEGDLGKGSCRSVEGCDIHQALGNCSALLESFGGHPMAAGLSIRRENLEAFRAAFERACREQLQRRPIPKRTIDIACLPELIDERLMHNFKMLEPFGLKNPKPTFALKNVAVAGVPRTMGREDNHLMFFVKGNGRSFKAVGWNMAQHMQLVSSKRPFSIIFSPNLNTFRGQSSIEFEIKDIRAEALTQ